MGKVKPQYFEELEENLSKKLGADWSRVSFQNIQYAPILQTPQDELWLHMTTNPNNDLDFRKLRKFLLFGFGDAGTIGYSAHRNKAKYIEVQQEIEAKLSSAYQALGGCKPVIIIAQSLGGQVISNYLWDAEKNLNLFSTPLTGSEDEQNFKRLTSCENLITTGCNIPLFSAGLTERKSFSKPTPQFKWDNYYDADDVLGWPLRQLGTDYHELVEDHEVTVGNMLNAWHPYSHGEYWDDKDVINPIVDTIKSKL